MLGPAELTVLQVELTQRLRRGRAVQQPDDPGGKRDLIGASVALDEHRAGGLLEEVHQPEQCRPRGGHSPVQGDGVEFDATFRADTFLAHEPGVTVSPAGEDDDGLETLAADQVVQFPGLEAALR